MDIQYFHYISKPMCFQVFTEELLAVQSLMFTHAKAGIHTEFDLCNMQWLASTKLYKEVIR